jgi:hypothetical protein
MSMIAVAWALTAAFLTPNARAEVNTRTEHFPDREVLHFTNYDPFNVEVTYNFSYEFKCNDPYYTWQLWAASSQRIAVNANGENNQVYYFPPCAGGTQVRKVVLQLLTSVRTDPPKEERPPVKPQPGNPQPGKSQPGNPQPGNPNPGNPSPGNPNPGNPQPGNPQPGNSGQGSSQPQPEPASPCNGPLGSWSSYATVRNGRVGSVSLSHGVLSLRYDDEKRNKIEYYQIPLSKIDVSEESGLAKTADSQGWNLLVSSKNGGRDVTWIRNDKKRFPNYGAAISIDFDTQENQEAAYNEIKYLVSICGGTALNDILRQSGKNSSREAVAIELDSSAGKSTGASTDDASARAASVCLRAEAI